jgi:hypothetical protein
VELTIPESSPFAGLHSLTAPLYGGPGMVAGEGVQVLALYGEFTDKTVFLVDEALARNTIIGKAAAVRVARGQGCLYLFGPHFEHPHYTLANRIVIEAILRDGNRITREKGRAAVKLETLSSTDTDKLIRTLKRELSNARIVAAGLEMMAIRWTIGAKTYEPEKIRVFLEAMWRRIKPLEKRVQLSASKGVADQIAAYARETTELLRTLKTQADQGIDTLNTARSVFDQLHRYTIAFFHIYFHTISQPAHNMFSGVTIEKQNNTLPAMG